MPEFTPLRDYKKTSPYKKGDVFVLFGELFSRGYANGLVENAKKSGMTIIGITVGRREKDNSLRPLTAEELATGEANLGGKIINVPLWAGYDLDPAKDGSTPTDQFTKVKPSTWSETKLDWDKIAESKETGLARFTNSIRESLSQMEALIPDGANVLFAHLMAGGIPKSKITFFLTNRSLKGKGEKFLPSENFWNSDVGRFSQENFYAVTAETYRTLIKESAGIRAKVEASGGKVCYTAYGYHGSEVLIAGKPQWQTYTPYLQGAAKIRLEEVAKEAWEQGVKACTYNCPEIRTNSSDLFSGVEISLYPLVTSLKNAGPDNTWVKEQMDLLTAKLNESSTLEGVVQRADEYHQAPEIQEAYGNFAGWPSHNNLMLAETMLKASEELMAMNADKKDLITDHLSQIVVDSTGVIMFNESLEPQGPVLWINHDVITAERLDTNS